MKVFECLVRVFKRQNTLYHLDCIQSKKIQKLKFQRLLKKFLASLPVLVLNKIKTTATPLCRRHI